MRTTIILIACFLVFPKNATGQTFDEVIAETRNFIENTAPSPPDMVRLVEIYISLIGSGDLEFMTNHVLSSEFRFNYLLDSIYSHPLGFGLLLNPIWIGPKYYGFGGEFVTTRGPCDRSDHWFRLIFPKVPSASSRNKLRLFLRNDDMFGTTRYRSVDYRLQNSLKVEVDQEFDYGNGSMPSKSYFIHGFIQRGGEQAYFLTMKISQLYVSVGG